MAWTETWLCRKQVEVFSMFSGAAEQVYNPFTSALYHNHKLSSPPRLAFCLEKTEQPTSYFALFFYRKAVFTHVHVSLVNSVDVQ